MVKERKLKIEPINTSNAKRIINSNCFGNYGASVLLLLVRFVCWGEKKEAEVKKKKSWRDLATACWCVMIAFRCCISVNFYSDFQGDLLRSVTLCNSVIMTSCWLNSTDELFLYQYLITVSHSFIKQHSLITPQLDFFWISWGGEFQDKEEREECTKASRNRQNHRESLNFFFTQHEATWSLAAQQRC